ncbi:MAG TPA: flagellar motor switch protein FliN [Bryobacteraceae bacterium]|jgi:flagellar motor switch protein FliN/FliY
MDHRVLNWTFETVAQAFAAAVQSMAGEVPAVRWEAAPAMAPAPEDIQWRQSFHLTPGSIWLAASAASWNVLGGHVMQSVEQTEDRGAALKTAFLDLVGQAMTNVAEALSTRLGHDVRPDSGDETHDPPSPFELALIVLRLPMGTVEIAAGPDKSFLEGILAENAGALPPVPQSKTFDLLLDVEMPLSVSFGRAQMPLKDVLKLTTGSILELDRTISEPVEVIVNNCAIARGEVVVVEGNFGVRIQQVISRQERLTKLT